jgi:hypothetical protein
MLKLNKEFWSLSLLLNYHQYLLQMQDNHSKYQFNKEMYCLNFRQKSLEKYYNQMIGHHLCRYLAANIEENKIA